MTSSHDEKVAIYSAFLTDPKTTHLVVIGPEEDSGRVTALQWATRPARGVYLFLQVAPHKQPDLIEMGYGGLTKYIYFRPSRDPFVDALVSEYDAQVVRFAAHPTSPAP